jgi:hypothetical protein
VIKKKSPGGVIVTLGVGSNGSGVYGETSAYYGTVEQQGRLSLYFHSLVWIKGAPMPEEARQLVMDRTSSFFKQQAEYLESVYQGHFMSGMQEQVCANVETASTSADYQDPTETLPTPPPLLCKKQCNECLKCNRKQGWWSSFFSTIDDILLKSNVHKCYSTLRKDGKQSGRFAFTGCLDNRFGKCKARFPRTIFPQIVVNYATGFFQLKHLETA